MCTVAKKAIDKLGTPQDKRIRVQKTTMRVFSEDIMKQKEEARKKIFEQRMSVQSKIVLRSLDETSLTPIEVSITYTHA